MNSFQECNSFVNCGRGVYIQMIPDSKKFKIRDTFSHRHFKYGMLNLYRWLYPSTSPVYMGFTVILIIWSWIFYLYLQIDWSEGWLVGLVVFHILLTTITVMTRNHHTTQAVLFFLLLLTVRSSETINQYAAKNWQSFSRQQYFDSQGMFISVVFSMPVLFNCMMMVVSFDPHWWLKMLLGWWLNFFNNHTCNQIGDLNFTQYPFTATHTCLLSLNTSHVNVVF